MDECKFLENGVCTYDINGDKAEIKRLQAEVERITDDKLQAYDDYTELSKKFDAMTARYNELKKTYDDIIVAANDNAEKLDRMTARCKAAEEVFRAGEARREAG